MDIAIELTERGFLPDFLIRLAIRWMRWDRLRSLKKVGLESRNEASRNLIVELGTGPIAVLPENPSEHMYEFPPMFFRNVLGRRLKYSCCYWPEGLNDLDAAEEAMLEQNCRRAQIRDGMDILDLGCGAGSLSFWLAEKYPNSRILAVSNVAAQKEFIDSQCGELSIGNIECVTADMNDFQPERRFDRVVSIELFDHMRNHKDLMGRVASWLNPGGKLFVHMVTHREYCIPEQQIGFDAWASRYFFYGGLVVSDDMLLHFQENLVLEGHWRVSGRHFERTVQAWLANLDARRERILSVLRDSYNRDEAARWLNRWRVMLMVFEEAFGCRHGEEWIISQYLFRKRGSP